MRKMMFHQVAAKLIKREIWIWKFLCNCKVYDSKSCKERQDLQVVEMTSGYPWTTKSSQTIREVYSGTYIHTYIHTYIYQRLAQEKLQLYSVFESLTSFFMSKMVYLLFSKPSMKQGSLFCFVLFATLRSPKLWCIHALGIFRKLSMSKGDLTWFETVWSYSVEAIDY
jgi:hypothetical protein